MYIIRHTPTLNAMAKQGLIKLANETGCKIGKHTIHYVDDICNGISQPFTYKGSRYQLTYVSGCFCPYVSLVGKA